MERIWKPWRSEGRCGLILSEPVCGNHGRRGTRSGWPLAPAVAVFVALLLCPGLLTFTEIHAQPEADWRLDVNRQVFKARSWNWVLRFVERQGDNLILGVAYINNASSPRPIFLAEDFEISTLLTDQAAATYPLLAVSGISGEATKVGRRKRKTALFTFPYPTEATQVSFSSVWITVWMMNAASRIQVEFPIPMPHDEGLLPVKD